MKHALYWILVWYISSVAANAATDKYAIRIHQIEAKFKLTFIDQSNPKIWLFAGLLDDKGHALPIAVPVSATDHDIMVATVASVNCALYYIAKQEQDAQKTVIEFVTDFDPLTINLP